uniref:TRP C-terminal domain-containing protein n=1 Tax=Amphimedon queenslandica TaxID=400682 RepID=A0A1X7UVE5_AMPQE
MTMLFHGVALLSLLPLVLVLPAPGLECRIYVDSSVQHVHGGTDNTSCWTGGAKTPCASLDHTLDGIKTLQDNCSKGIDIYLYPGYYQLYTYNLEEQVQRNNVSIIGIIDNSTCEVATIECDINYPPSFNWSSYNIVFQCVEVQYCLNPPFTKCTDPNKPLPDRTSNLYLYTYGLCNDDPRIPTNSENLLCEDNEYSWCQCETVKFNAYVYDGCAHATLFPEELQVCITRINSLIVHDCYTAESQSLSCTNTYYTMEYEVPKCFDDYINADFELSLFIKPFDSNTNSTLNITVSAACASGYNFENENRTCVKTPQPPPPTLPTFKPKVCNNAYNIPYYADCDNVKCCSDNATHPYDQHYYANCASKGVPVNNLYTCVECGEYDLLIFIAVEIVPITVMVLLIIIFNIQLTNGSINGVVFYSQSIAIIYPIYIHYYYYDDDEDDFSSPDAVLLTQIPCNIFNLDFTPFVNHPLCISTNTTPLGVLSFWYVIGFYPLLLLLLLYVWMTLYDKGFKCVVFITRPFHRCMARFWSMTGIEPSFTHSIASIYILCFTQLAATSFKLLSYNLSDYGNAKFFHNMKQGYFQGVHAVAGSFAILVLLIMIVLPTLYILLYRFQWFHKLLDCLHLRKQLLISLGDVFTGPYKNGAENTFDYRFFAGLYLLARILVLCQFIFGTNHIFMVSVPTFQFCCSLLIAVMVLIFRPFRRNIHNFTEFFAMFIAMGIGFLTIMATAYLFEVNGDPEDSGDSIVTATAASVIPIINSLFFGIIIPIYIIYQVYKMIKSCYRYYKRNIPVAIRDQEDEEEYQPLVGNHDDWVADRMENPQEYDEQHVPGKMDDMTGEDQEPVTIATAATYGSTNNATVN